MGDSIPNLIRVLQQVLFALQASERMLVKKEICRPPNPACIVYFEVMFFVGVLRILRQQFICVRNRIGVAVLLTWRIAAASSSACDIADEGALQKLFPGTDDAHESQLGYLVYLFGMHADVGRVASAPW